MMRDYFAICSALKEICMPSGAEAALSPSLPLAWTHVRLERHPRERERNTK